HVRAGRAFLQVGLDRLAQGFERLREEEDGVAVGVVHGPWFLVVSWPALQAGGDAAGVSPAHSSGRPAMRPNCFAPARGPCHAGGMTSRRAIRRFHPLFAAALLLCACTVQAPPFAQLSGMLL